MSVILNSGSNSESRKELLYHQVLHLHLLRLHLYPLTLRSLTWQSPGVLCIFCKFCLLIMQLSDAGIIHQFPLLMKYQHSKENNLLKFQHVLILVSILLKVNTFTSHLIFSGSQPQLYKNHFADRKKTSKQKVWDTTF